MHGPEVLFFRFGTWHPGASAANMSTPLFSCPSSLVDTNAQDGRLLIRRACRARFSEPLIDWSRAKMSVQGPEYHHLSEAGRARRIAVVGAGQSGLQIAFGLLDRGYQVTLVTNRDADEIASGKVMSSQCMFGSALDIERAAGLNWWERLCPPIEGIGLTLHDPLSPGEQTIDWAARLDKAAQSVDQRLKMAAWLDVIARRGARIELRDADVQVLEELSASHDLVLLASGKGDVAKLFVRDAKRSAFDKPQRALGMTYVHGLAPSEGFSRISYNVIPGVGEYLVFPALTLTGPCHIMVFEGVMGGPFDCWHDAGSPAQHLALSLALLKAYLPREYARCAHVELTDPNGILSGKFAPTVREPVATLPSGRLVFGLGDTVVLNDPLTGQGANGASKCSRIYLDAIFEHGDAPFTREWMTQTFERYWQYAQYAVQWTNGMLLTPPAEAMLKLYSAAARSGPLASAIVNAFDHPPSLFTWLSMPQSQELHAAH